MFLGVFVVVDCGVPSAEGFGFTLAHGSTELGSVYNVSCVDGWDASANLDPITCQADGMWSPISASCSCNS